MAYLFTSGKFEWLWKQRAGYVVELGGSIYCARVSELLEQPGNATCRPYFVWKLCLQLSRIIFVQLI